MGQVLLPKESGKCENQLLLPKEFKGLKDAKPPHNACTCTVAISLLQKESGKHAVRPLLRKESEGPEDAKPHHRAYTGTAEISLLQKESGKRENRLPLRKELRGRKMLNSITEPIQAPRRFHSFKRSRGNARIGYSFGRSLRD